MKRLAEGIDMKELEVAKRELVSVEEEKSLVVVERGSEMVAVGTSVVVVEMLLV